MMNHCESGYEGLTDKQIMIVDAIRRGDVNWLEANCSRWAVKGLHRQVAKSEISEKMRAYLLEEMEARRESY